MRQQKANNDGNVSVGRVIRDTLIGAAVGAASVVVATATATALVATFGATTITGAASLTLSQSIGVGMFSSTAGGAAARYTNSALNNRFSPEKPPTNPIQEATNPKAMAVDAVIGVFGGAITHIMTGGVYETPASRQHAQDMLASQKNEAGANDSQIPKVENSQTGHQATGCSGGSRGTQGIGNPVQIEGRGSTGRTIPNNLNEQLAMRQVQSDPLASATKIPIQMNDSRWPASEGWVKMESIVQFSDGTKATIHFVYNELTGLFDDFKFK